MLYDLIELNRIELNPQGGGPMLLGIGSSSQTNQCDIVRGGDSSLNLPPATKFSFESSLVRQSKTFTRSGIECVYVTLFTRYVFSRSTKSRLPAQSLSASTQRLAATSYSRSTNSRSPAQSLSTSTQRLSATSYSRSTLPRLSATSYSRSTKSRLPAQSLSTSSQRLSATSYSRSTLPRLPATSLSRSTKSVTATATASAPFNGRGYCCL